MQRAQLDVGLQVVVEPCAHGLPGLARGVESLQRKQCRGHAAQALGAPGQGVGLFTQQHQMADAFVFQRPGQLFAEGLGHRHQVLDRRRFQRRQQVEDRAVDAVLRGQRGLQTGTQRGHRGAGVVAVVTQITVGFDVERHFVAGEADHEGAARAQRVAHAQLVEHVGVVQRNVGDHDVGMRQQLEHVLADVAGLDDDLGGGAIDSGRAHRGVDQLTLHTLVVHLIRFCGSGHDLAHAERPHHESAPSHAGSPVDTGRPAGAMVGPPTGPHQHQSLDQEFLHMSNTTTRPAVQLLAVDELAERVKAQLPKWTLEGGALCRVVRTAGWKGTLMVVNTIGHLAEAAWHHPDLAVSYNRVRIALSTHEAAGITARDLALAEKIEQVLMWQPGAEPDAVLEGTPDEPRHAYILYD